MRKIKPADVRAAFEGEADYIVGYFTRVANGLAGTKREAGDVSELAETVFLTAFVAFERFLSDLFLAYLNRDFSRYQADLESRIKESVKSKHGSWSEQRISLAREKHVKVSELEDIVDSEGRNLVFRSAAMLRDRAREWLVHPHQSRVLSIDEHDARLIDTTRAIRNYLAHQSRRAKAEMDKSLAAVDAGPPNRGLGRTGNKVKSVGVFLKAMVAGQPRVLCYVQRLRDIALKI